MSILTLLDSQNYLYQKSGQLNITLCLKYTDLPLMSLLSDKLYLLVMALLLS